VCGTILKYNSEIFFFVERKNITHSDCKFFNLTQKFLETPLE
jgi:hypothetical protein